MGTLRIEIKEKRDFGGEGRGRYMIYGKENQ